MSSKRIVKPSIAELSNAGSSTLLVKSVANIRPYASSNDSISSPKMSGVCLAMRTASSKDTKYGTSPIIIGGMISWFEGVGWLIYKSNKYLP